MNKKKKLKINGETLDKNQLKNHLKKIAANHDLTTKSDKKTYPIPHLLDNFKYIQKVYFLLNEHLSLGLSIHPAGEWLLDNFYIVEESVKQIEKELTLKKYRNFLGVSNGEYKGYARIYVLASEIVAYTDNKIEKGDLEDFLESYQTKRTLSMEEIWNIGLFLQIAIIENIKIVCEKIFSSQIQKYKAENIVERLIEKKDKNRLIFKNKKIIEVDRKSIKDSPDAFIEYMGYILKRYGKKGNRYLNALEDIMELKGTTISDIIKKEHFNIAVNKVSIGNSIVSIKKIQRINFLEIFEKVNGVEELLKKDPSKVYEKMDSKTKEYYRNKIKEISKKTKISEIYISKKILELAEKGERTNKTSHIGYYLIDKGVEELYKKLNYKVKRKIDTKTKIRVYIGIILILSILLSILLSAYINIKINNIWIFLFSIFIFLIPSTEIVVQLIQFLLSKIVKTKLIPKIDMINGVDETNSTMVVIPTIIKSKEKVNELMKKLEVFYLANKSQNIYFTLLGDCSTGNKEIESFDEEVIKEGINQVERLNKKYEEEQQKIPKFNFIYRNRIYNEKEKAYLGWERKRGLLNQFNDYLLGNINDPFRENSIEKKIKDTNNELRKELSNIKYIITLDSDTDLILESAFKLIGAMSHILNKPIIDIKKNIVIEGYGIMQPRVGINLDISYKSLFTKIFAGNGGIDSYTNAVSDLYQDNFDEGIFTGKGIYDLKIFSKVLKNQIPENTVLSHDLLEGCYLRCGLVSDIKLMDGYPTKYNSFMDRLYRWIRGDWQLIKWLSRKSKLNLLSKYKIIDNLRRSLLEISIITGIIYSKTIETFCKKSSFLTISLMIIIAIFPYLLELFNNIILKKEGEEKQKTFISKISGINGNIIRGILTLGCLPYKAYISTKAIIITLYRTIISHNHLLEWTTSEETEMRVKSTIISYYTKMIINIIVGASMIIISIIDKNILWFIYGVYLSIIPYIMYVISKEEKTKNQIEKLDKRDIEYVKEIGRKTWKFFEEYLTKENNYLIPDNYQEDRKDVLVDRTSSTNIGLSMLAVISASDLKYIKKENAIVLLKNIILSVDSLQKWNGHLYNWYNIKTKEPLVPKYISTVDSGNFIGYLYTVKVFLEENRFYNKNNLDSLIEIVNNLINETDFSVLYNNEQQLFSIGFNIEENKLTDSYYDLLASEARQASLVAIAKKDIPSKHWNHLGKTLTVFGKYKGLISWSGTSFEYLMPNIIIPKYKASLIDESIKFMIKSQQEYAKRLKIPWGISESAFYLKDLKSNYQYKAFGIPWLGLKRGLGDDLVVSSYGGVLAITEVPKDEIQNLRILEKEGMYGKYGFFESIDYTPERVEKGKNSNVVKTYMAHHQGLILLSINNLFNNNILQKRFISNPEIEAVSILLQETMPEKAIITKEKKEKIDKLKYKDYEDYIVRTYNKIDERLITGNFISNENYLIAMNQKGEGISKYKDLYINRFKRTSDNSQGIFFNIKNIKNKNIWSSNYKNNDIRQTQYKINFMPDKDEQELLNGNIKTKIKTTVVSNEPVEIRRIVLENLGTEEEILELTCYFEPILSTKEQDYAHPVFNNLFLTYDYDEELESLLVKRRTRTINDKRIYMETTLSTTCETIGDLEYEIDNQKFIGRGNLGIPQMVKKSIPFSKKIGLVTEGIVALKRTIKIKPDEKISVDFILSIGEDKEIVKQNLIKYKNEENVKKEFELSKAKTEAESRYLGIKGKEIEQYQKMLSYIVFDYPIINKQNKRQFKQEQLWKFGISGDLPIILVKIRDINDSYVLKEVLKAYTFFKTKNVKTEIVIIDEERHSYEKYVKEEIEETILNQQMSYLKNTRGGIYILSREEIELEDIELLEFVSTIIIDSKKGGIENNIKDLEEEYLEKYELIEEKKSENSDVEKDDIDISLDSENMKYYNEYGGFSKDGKEYLIIINKEHRLPTVWSHVLANKKFGTIITENMGGYSWYKNSRLNRITAWNNSPNLDIPSEIIYLQDIESKKTWSLGINPKADDENYNIIYGFGYGKYIHKSCGIEQELTVFVPREDSCKIGILNLKNTTSSKKKIKLYYYIKPVIGEDEIKTDGYINTKFDRNNNILICKNLYGESSNMQVYMASSEKIISYTGDKKFFQGKGGIENPDALRKEQLNNENSLGRKTCIVYQIEIDIDSFSNKEISLILGADEKEIDCKNIAYKYSKIQNCKEELEKVKNAWKELTGKLQIYTPLESINILLNGWIPYQTIVSRLIGRSGYYQSGGAIGFRDQLQDVLGLKYINPELLKNQIIKHSKHQFIEGDVLHWWHEETNKGIRTKFSDDLLWLVYAVIEYIRFTGDKSILEIETPYLKGKVLEENEDEKYDKYEENNIKETIYMHCIRAINKSMNLGENGLPKIGTGDWNDGFSTVGNKGKGESVWLGFFLYKVLNDFIDICKDQEDDEKLNKYKSIIADFKKALNTKGWDGRWFRRAFMDDGNVLGSMENDECRIDSIAQSWSIISNAADNDKKYISIESLENHLIDKENRIVKLLDPPFEKSKLEPGYIKGYVPGVRENGGQYTHECCC